MSILIVRRGLQGNRGLTGLAAAETITLVNNLEAVLAVAGSIEDVNTTADSIASVNTNAAHIANIDTVAGHINNVDTVATHVANVDTVATHIANVDIVAAHIDNVDIVATNVEDVNTAADNIDDIIAAPGFAQDAETAMAQAQAAAAAAAASAAQGLFREVVNKSFANSPLVPIQLEEGYLFRIDTSGGNFIVNLAALVATYGEDVKFAFVKVTPDANTITVNVTSPDDIQGGSSISWSAQFEVHVIVGDYDTSSWIDIVQSADVADGSITTAKLANLAVTTAKINNGAVDDTKLASNAVTTVKINDGAVTEAKQTLADNTTNDFSTTKHGYVPKGTNTGKMLFDDGTWKYSYIKQNSKSAAYTATIDDGNTHIYHPTTDATARIWTIPANASVAYPIGTAITFVNDVGAGAITIAITTDTLVQAVTGSTGSRTLAAGGIATAIKVTSTRWMISGVGLS